MYVEFAKRWFVMLLLGSWICGFTWAARPNIVFILTDDQGYGDCGRHGHPLLKTPNLDRLFDESVRFDNFYVSPSCSPTRAALLTGMHELRNGVSHTIRNRTDLNLAATLLPQLLKQAGYRTGLIGKWHLGETGGHAPENRGFDVCIKRPGNNNEFSLHTFRNGEQREAFREDIYFDVAMRFMEESGNQPFFCYLSTYAPHSPLVAPEEDIAPFRGKGLTEKQATYLGEVANIEKNMGRLLEFLHETKREDNTVLVFMNDNGQTHGLDVYNAGMRGCKCTIWHGGSRAMSFWRWPKHWPPHTVDNLSAHLDVLPTLCEITGATIPDEVQSKLDGFSLLPLLESKDPLVWHEDRFLYQHVARWPGGTAAGHKYAMCGVRQGTYLLLRSEACSNPDCDSLCAAMRVSATKRMYTEKNAKFHWGASPQGKWALFDTKLDPACQKDLSFEKKELVSLLSAAYDKWWDAIYPEMIQNGGNGSITQRRR
ncbi:arylsulfatase [Planctomycetota bacterium]